MPLDPLVEEIKDVPALIDWLKEADSELLAAIYAQLGWRFYDRVVDCGSHGDIEGMMVWADRIHDIRRIVEELEKVE